MSDNSLDLNDSAFLVKIKGEMAQLRNRVEELAEKVDEEPEIPEDFYDGIEQTADIESVDVGDEYIDFELSDGRYVSIPLWWSWRLEAAGDEIQSNHSISEDGNRVVWPNADEEITVQGILTGGPAPRPDQDNE